MRTPFFLAVIIFLLGHSSTDAEPQVFEDEKLQLQIEYDQSWRTQSVDSPSVLLLLKDYDHTFPNFNILLVGRRYDSSLPKSEQEQQLIESYSLAGIKDTTIQKSQLKAMPFGLAFESTLRYSISGADYHSKVLIVPRADVHLVMTYVSDVNIDPKRYQKLIAGVSLPEISQTTSEPTKNLQDSRSLVLALLCVSIILFLRWWYGTRQLH